VRKRVVAQNLARNLHEFARLNLEFARYYISRKVRNPLGSDGETLHQPRSVEIFKILEIVV